MKNLKMKLIGEVRTEDLKVGMILGSLFGMPLEFISQTPYDRVKQTYGMMKYKVAADWNEHFPKGREGESMVMQSKYEIFELVKK